MNRKRKTNCVALLLSWPHNCGLFLLGPFRKARCSAKQGMCWVESKTLVTATVANVTEHLAWHWLEAIVHWKPFRAELLFLCNCFNSRLKQCPTIDFHLCDASVWNLPLFLVALYSINTLFSHIFSTVCDSVTYRNEYQETSWGQRAAEA